MPRDDPNRWMELAEFANVPMVGKLRHVGAERQSSSYGLNVLERSRHGDGVDVPHTRAEYSRYAMEPASV